MEATQLRKNFFETLREIEVSIEVVRNGRVAAILSPPPHQDGLRYDRRRLARICERNKIRRLSVFGSFARGTDFGPESDVDVIVELTPRTKKSFVRHMDAIFELQDLFGRSVDLCYQSELVNCDPDTRDVITREAKVLYEAR